MGDPISKITQSAIPQGQQNRTGGGQSNPQGQSFESVLQQGQGGQALPSAGSADTTRVSGAKLEELRAQLAQRIETLPPGSPKLNALLPEFFEGRTRLGMLGEVMKTANTNRAGMDLKGRFGQVEGEWNQIEGIMKSEKDLSTGELLGLQARMYQVSQHIEVMSKVVDQVTSGIKTILNTNV